MVWYLCRFDKKKWNRVKNWKYVITIEMHMFVMTWVKFYLNDGTPCWYTVEICWCEYWDFFNLFFIHLFILLLCFYTVNMHRRVLYIIIYDWRGNQQMNIKHYKTDLWLLSNKSFDMWCPAWYLIFRVYNAAQRLQHIALVIECLTLLNSQPRLNYFRLHTTNWT